MENSSDIGVVEIGISKEEKKAAGPTDFLFRAARLRSILEKKSVTASTPTF